MDKEKSKGKVDRNIESSTTKKESVSPEEKKKEKKMSTAQKALPVMIVTTIALAIILLVTLMAFFQLKADEKQNAATLEAVYASSYFTMVDGINNLQVDSAKFETLDNASSQRKSLKNMELDCQYVLSGLRVLPIEAENCIAATKFFNQINGMCEAYVNKLDQNKALTAEDIAMVTEMGFALGTIKEQFNLHNQSVTKGGNYSFIDASVFNSKGVNEFSTSLGSLKSENVDYPVMIFDGPFSASLEDNVVNGLSEKVIDEETATNYVKEKVFANRDNVQIKYLGEVNGDIECYRYSAKISSEEYEVQVTKREGKLLTLTANLNNKNAVMTKGESIALAENYAKLLGFESMKSVWYESKESIAYINLAPIVGGIIYYPDLVKVKVDLGNQLVTGFESTNYCLNHQTRNFTASIGEADAKSVIVGDYNIKDVNLALIPLDNKSEILTYEFVCDGLDGTYYFYVNAKTKQIEQNLKVVDQDGVNKLI